jgi:hypothetical protein
MNQLQFYTKEEIQIIEDELINNNGLFLTDMAEKLSKTFNRPYDGLLSKIHKTKKRLIQTNLVEVKNVKTNNPIKRLPGRPKKENKVINKLEKSNYEPIVEQQPAEVGVEVPHGMTFEGKPKRIMLHSDHFRIYF